RDEGADATEADDADRLLVELGSRVRRALPLARGEARVRRGNVAREAQDVTDRELGRADDVRGGRVDDHDAGFGGRLDVDVVEADAGARHDLEGGGRRERLRVDLGRGADEH